MWGHYLNFTRAWPGANCHHAPVILNSFFFRCITSFDIVDVICNLENSNTVYIFGLNARIINACLIEGTFPEKFKICRVVPVFKMGSTKHAKNYRLISIIPIFCKFLEFILKPRTAKFLVWNNLLNLNQLGIRSVKSSVGAISKLIRDIVRGIEKGNCVALTLCDLSSVFDCVDLHRFLEMFEFFFSYFEVTF